MNNKIAITTLVLALAALPANAQEFQPQIFAYPGKSCPEGSRLLKGPETKRAETSGAVYCVFERRAFTFSKAKFGEKCPVGHEQYQDEKFQPDADTLWCARMKPPGPLAPPVIPPPMLKK